MDAAGPERTYPALMGVVAVAVLLTDQLTKWWALESLGNGRVIDLVWTLRFRLVFNTGASFSLGGGYGQWIAVVAVGVAIFLVWQGRMTTSKLGAVALGLVLGGSLGNLSDRVFRAEAGPLSGAVVDFVDAQWWPVFNVADAAIVVGAILLVASMARPAPA